MPTHYEILGVNKDSTDEEIKKAYKKLALKWHPDRNKAPEAKQKFQDIARAYEILSDPDKKRHYDMTGSDPSINDDLDDEMGGFSGFKGFPGNVHFRTSSNMDHEELFKNFFGQESPFTANFGGFNNMRNPHRTITEHDLPCTIEELYTGVTKKITINNGKTLNVEVKAGWKEGTKISFDDDNIKFVIKEKPHNTYTREENDLHITITIAYKDMINGITKSIKLPNGVSENFIVKNLKSSDQTHIIKNKGMPIRKNGKEIGKGNIIVHFIINF